MGRSSADILRYSPDNCLITMNMSNCSHQSSWIIDSYQHKPNSLAKLEGTSLSHVGWFLPSDGYHFNLRSLSKRDLMNSILDNSTAYAKADLDSFLSEAHNYLLLGSVVKCSGTINLGALQKR